MPDQRTKRRVAQHHIDELARKTNPEVKPPDPQDTLAEDWHAFEADREIDQEGLRTALVNAIDLMIDESIGCLLCNVFGHTAQYDPKVSLDYAKVKLERCLERMGVEK